MYNNSHICVSAYKIIHHITCITIYNTTAARISISWHLKFVCLVLGIVEITEKTLNRTSWCVFDISIWMYLMKLMFFQCVLYNMRMKCTREGDVTPVCMFEFLNRSADIHNMWNVIYAMGSCLELVHFSVLQSEIPWQTHELMRCEPH
jgi:hypothetical protein